METPENRRNFLNRKRLEGLIRERIQPVYRLWKMWKVGRRRRLSTQPPQLPPQLVNSRQNGWMRWGQEKCWAMLWSVRSRSESSALSFSILSTEYMTVE